MNLSEHTALVTGANRGIGSHFVAELLERGVRKVYATARQPELLQVPGVQVLRLDLLDHESVAEAARVASDVTLLVNNAGIGTSAPLLTGDLAEAHRHMDTHFWGTLEVIRAFAPVLASHGGGSIVNVLSALSWFVSPGNGAYAASKSAEWSLTNAVRLDLAAQGTFVQGVHLGAADTDMMSGYDGPKTDPRAVARASLDGLAAGRFEVLVDDTAVMVKASLAGDPADLYGAMLAG